MMEALYRPFQPVLTRSGLQRLELTMQYSPPTCKNLIGIVHSYLQISVVKPTSYTVIPDGTQSVFIGPHSTQIGGAQSQSLELQIQKPGDYFGIRFYPGVLRHFFVLNLSDITDQLVESRYFPCYAFSKLHDHIYKKNNFLQRARVCEQWLLQRFTRQPLNTFDQALELIYQSVGNIEIGKLADTLELSSRHLNRLFKQYTGLSTKTFAQIVRIQSACRDLFKNPNNSLKTATKLGFFDQAHLLKEYKQRFLLNPSALFNRFRSDFYNSSSQ